jgi:hypothetical protein
MASFPCFKCDGKGIVSGFSHIESGRCFQCGGKGTLAYRKPAPAFEYQDKPGFPVLPEATRSTHAQWEFLEKLAGGNSDLCCKLIKEAGCPYATGVYVSRVVMSKAIDLAKKSRASGK